MNPYAILLAVGLVIGASTGGYRFGVSHERGAAALRINEAAVAAAEQARVAAVAESARALADAKAAAARRAAARDRQHQLELEIARDETALRCRISDGTFGVLKRAIDAANGAEAKTDPAGVPAVAGADRADGFRPGQMDRGWLGNVRRLPGVAEAAGGLDQ